MKLNTGILKLALLPVILVLAVPQANADFDKRWYIGLGGGVSFIEPDPNTSGYKVDEDSDTGAKIFVGWDFAERWALEVYVADLGEATLDTDPNRDPAIGAPVPPNGAVAYKAAGLAAVYHLYSPGGSTARSARDGMSLYAKLGAGALDTESDDLRIEQVEDAHLMVGLGVEYAFETGLGVRGEFEAFDQDAQLLSLNLLWRFGGSGGSTSSSVIGPVVAASDSQDGQPQTSPTTMAKPADKVVITEDPQIDDSDLDGVADAFDQCAATAAQILVDASGCPMFDKTLEGVSFVSGSANLTAAAKSALDKMAFNLVRLPDVRIAIMAHTDNSGPAAANLELSKQRALSVARYLVSRGVTGQRIRPEAYGESQPVVSNATPEGRKRNRRVEFRTLN